MMGAFIRTIIYQQVTILRVEISQRPPPPLNSWKGLMNSLILASQHMMKSLFYKAPSRTARVEVFIQFYIDINCCLEE